MFKTKVATSTRRMRGSISGPLIVLGSVLLAALLIVNHQSIVDHFIAWQFHPSSTVSKLADESGMSNHGKFLYFASQPQIDDRSSFNAECRDKDSSDAILGCYTNDRIYIFNVSDARLDGIKATTAAHEMLHAAYARLSSKEQTHVNAMLEAAYTSLSSSGDLAQRMALYAKIEPGERDNELHSVLGTEVSNLPKDLETYYERYFSDRSKVVAEHDAYQSVFTKLQDRAKVIQNQMMSLQQTIESSSAQYSSDVKQLRQDIDDFNKRANAGEFSSQSQFTSERDQLMARTNHLEQERQSINSSIDTYNSLNQELATIAAQDQALNQSINSQLPAAPSI